MGILRLALESTTTLEARVKGVRQETAPTQQDEVHRHLPTDTSPGA